MSSEKVPLRDKWDVETVLGTVDMMGEKCLSLHREQQIASYWRKAIKETSQWKGKGHTKK